MLVTEETHGALFKGRFRWLVSCKHFAKSGKSINERDELNILERMESFCAQGFIGFYPHPQGRREDCGIPYIRPPVDY